MSFLQATIDHLANKLFPLVIIGFLLWAQFGFDAWQPYTIMGLIFFIQKYHFKLGYYSRLIESEDISYEKESEMEE